MNQRDIRKTLHWYKNMVGLIWEELRWRFQHLLGSSELIWEVEGVFIQPDIHYNNRPLLAKLGEVITVLGDRAALCGRGAGEEDTSVNCFCLDWLDRCQRRDSNHDEVIRYSFELGKVRNLHFEYNLVCTITLQRRYRDCFGKSLLYPLIECFWGIWHGSDFKRVAWRLRVREGLEECNLFWSWFRARSAENKRYGLKPGLFNWIKGNLVCELKASVNAFCCNIGGILRVYVFVFLAQFPKNARVFVSIQALHYELAYAFIEFTRVFVFFDNFSYPSAIKDLFVLRLKFFACITQSLDVGYVFLFHGSDCFSNCSSQLLWEYSDLIRLVIRVSRVWFNKLKTRFLNFLIVGKP